MSILYLLIPLAVVLMAVAIGFFVWTIRNGQYEDMEGPAYRILMDDDEHLVPNRRPDETPEESAHALASGREAADERQQKGRG